MGLSADELRRLLLNGLRISEALGADMRDYGHDRGHRVLRVTRKGGEVGRVPLAPPVIRALDSYLEGRTSGPIFLGRDGKSRLGRTTVDYQLQVMAKAAGIPAADLISPHSLRHSFATEALTIGVPLQDVQDALGHADPRTTRRYDRSRNKLDRSPTYLLATHLHRDDTDAGTA